jgi:hypothetical protein
METAYQRATHALAVQRLERLEVPTPHIDDGKELRQEDQQQPVAENRPVVFEQGKDIEWRCATAGGTLPPHLLCRHAHRCPFVLPHLVLIQACWRKGTWMGRNSGKGASGQVERRRLDRDRPRRPWMVGNGGDWEWAAALWRKIGEKETSAPLSSRWRLIQVGAS